MKIAYLQRSSLIDYPGRISAVIFTQGCNFVCPYCHNPELVKPELFTESVNVKEIFDFLELRKNKLEGIVITGGEPTLQKGLIPFMKSLRQMGYKLKLDTNGSKPEVIETLIQERLVDFIAMDIKAPHGKYSRVAGKNVDINALAKSIHIIMNSGAEYEFRTTAAKKMIDSEDLKSIVQMIEGADRYVIQKFISSKHLDDSLKDSESLTLDDIRDCIPVIEKQIKKLIIRL